MVKHVILWKLKEELTAEEKENVKAGIKEGLEGLAGNIYAGNRQHRRESRRIRAAGQ